MLFVVVYKLLCRAFGSSCFLIFSSQVVWSVLFVKLCQFHCGLFNLSLIQKRLSRLVCVLQVFGLFRMVSGGFLVLVGGFVWVRLFKLVRTCSGCFSFFIVLDCVGLLWL